MNPVINSEIFDISYFGEVENIDIAEFEAQFISGETKTFDHFLNELRFNLVIWKKKPGYGSGIIEKWGIDGNTLSVETINYDSCKLTNLSPATETYFVRVWKFN